MSFDEVARLLREHGYVRREEAFQLSSGQWSHDYVDGKRALAAGAHLRTAAEAVVALARESGVTFKAVGGLTMGADPLAHAVAVVSGASWFSVRKEPKGHGRRQQIEGAALGPGVSVLLLEDVVSTGGSIMKALDAVRETGAAVVLATTLLDRGDSVAPAMAALGVLYQPITTYRDLGIAPVCVE